MSPQLSLLLFAGLVGLLAWVFWPRSGPVARLARMVRLTDRVLEEDALKHLLDCELRGTSASLESLAGALETPRSRVLRLVGQLEATGLAGTGNGGFHLTAEGRRYALRLLRAHRLVERYLADRTGMAPGEWHAEAEHLEHRLDADATERLARRMGDPVYDPHGDPIPTAEGAMPDAHGVPLHSLPAGTPGRIVHLEDEPRDAYERLFAMGLAPGMGLCVTEVTPERIGFTMDGRALSLAPTLARNVTVVPHEEAGAGEPVGQSLATLRMGEQAAVVGIVSACQGPQRRRLLDLGVVPGTVVRGALSSAAGDPVAYEIRGALIALRRQQAEWIRVRPLSGDQAA